MVSISRDDKEKMIEELAEAYPKCFFVNPKQRLPLKKTIASDLQKDGFLATEELLEAHGSAIGAGDTSKSRLSPTRSTINEANEATPAAKYCRIKLGGVVRRA